MGNTYRNQFAAVIQARLSSKRCPNKMLRSFAGTTLLDIALEKFTKRSRFYSFYFAAYEEELIHRAQKYDCAIIRRDSASAHGEQISVIMNYLKEIPRPYIIFINACSPCLEQATVERAVEVFVKNKCLSLTAVVKKHTWFYTLAGKPVNFLDPTTLNTKFTEPLYAVTHNIHIFERERFLKHGYFWAHRPKDPYLFEIDDRQAMDIDTEYEFTLADAWYRAQQRPAGLKRLRDIRLLISDVDGVLTDAGMYYSEQGEFGKKFNTRDGMGIKMLQQKNIPVAVITGEDTPIVKTRMKKLGVRHVYMGITNKAEIVKKLSKKLSVPLENIAYVGDDVNDVSALKIVGMPIAVADAAEDVKHHAFYVTRARGGEGAIREVCDMILTT